MRRRAFSPHSRNRTRSCCQVSRIGRQRRIWGKKYCFSIFHLTSRQNLERMLKGQGDPNQWTVFFCHTILHQVDDNCFCSKCKFEIKKIANLFGVNLTTELLSIFASNIKAFLKFVTWELLSLDIRVNISPNSDSPVKWYLWLAQSLILKKKYHQRWR